MFIFVTEFCNFFHTKSQVSSATVYNQLPVHFDSDSSLVQLNGLNLRFL